MHRNILKNVGALLNFMPTPIIIQNLEKARRLAFPSFAKIVLEPSAVRLLVNLFLHPGCKSDINLAKFLTGQPVNLTEISPHIITAFPSQLAKFASKKNKIRISENDLLECFALDHVNSVEENQKSLLFEPAYALAHVLTIGKVKSLQTLENRHLAEVLVKVCEHEITFKHVLVPLDLPVRVNQVVFHHFGVVVAKADSQALKNLASQLQKRQNKKGFLQKITKQIVSKSIDFAKSAFFKVDMAGQIIKESKRDFDFQKIWQADDLQKIKMPMLEKIMFSS